MRGTARHGFTAAVCCTGLLAAAIAGCSSTTATSKPSASATSGSPSSSASSSPTASPTSTAPAALNAGQLYFLLLPASSMPKGFKLWGSDNNGNAVPKDSPAPVPASKVCGDLQNSSYIQVGGFKTADWAMSSFLTSDKSMEIDEEIDVFQGTDAQAAMTAMWNAFGHCKAYTYTNQGQTISMTLSRAKVNNKWPEIRAFQSSPQYTNGGTLVAIRVGNAIVTIGDTSDASNADYFAISLAEQIASRVSAAEGLK